MSHDTVDIYNPKVTRSTMGSIFRVPFVYVDDLLEVAETMKQKEYHHVCSTSQWNRLYEGRLSKRNRIFHWQ